MKKFEILWLGGAICLWCGVFNMFDFMFVWLFCALVLGVCGVAEKWGK